MRYIESRSRSPQMLMKKILLIAAVLLALLPISAAGIAHLFPAQTMAVLQDIERGLAGVEQQSVRVGAFDWPYLEGGQGETILMVHGFGGDKDNWTRFAREMAQEYRVIVPDLPGFGENQRLPEQLYGMGPQVQRLHAFVEKMQLDRFHIVGNSMGGHISALYAHAHPERVESLALFNNAGITTAKNSEVFDEIEAGRNPLLVDSVEDFDRLLGLMFHEMPYIPGPLKQYFAERAFKYREFTAKIFEDYREDFTDLEPILSDIETRTLVLWGDVDRVLDVSAVPIMDGGLPNSSAVIMQQCGHIPMIERPAETAEHYRSFLDG